MYTGKINDWLDAKKKHRTVMKKGAYVARHAARTKLGAVHRGEGRHS